LPSSESPYSAPSSTTTPRSTRIAGPQLRRGRWRRRRNWGPAILVLLGVVVLLGALYGLSLLGKEDDTNAPVAQPTPTRTPAPKKAAKKKKARPPAPTRVSLRLIASGPVYVCLVDANGRAVLNGVTLTAGQRSRTFHSRRFRANFGNGAIRMRINGHTYPAAQSADPIGYEMRPTGRPRKLSETARAALCT